MATMHLRFDPSLEYQREAIAAVTDLFDGLPMADTPLSITTTASALPLTETGVGNTVALDPLALLTNLQKVQDRNAISKTLVLGEPRFAVEMETGTGKTYVYLRTIFELHKHYGLKK